MSVDPFIKGEISTTKSWFQDQERFNFGKQTDDITKKICSIRARRLKAGKLLSEREQKQWVPIKIGNDTGVQEEIFLNINSIIRHTGLTKTQIQEAARNPDKLYKMLQSAMSQSVNLVEGLRSELTLSKERIEQGKTYTFPCDAAGGVGDGVLSRVFKMTENEVAIAKKQKLFEYTPPVKGNGVDEFSCHVTLKIPPPVGKELKKMVRDIHKFKKNFITSSSANSDKAAYGILEKKWKKVSGVRAFISSEGDIYLASLSKKIGKGTFKSVWSGVKIATAENAVQEKVAIGIPHESDDPEVLKSEKNEIGFLQKLQNGGGPGVCKIHACFNINIGKKISRGRTGIILHYYNGGDLADNIHNLRTQHLSKKIHTQALIMNKLAAGLAYIHQNNIVHRDIKPENVLLVKEGETITDAVFADFGLSTEGETCDGIKGGTPSYLSPKQWDKGGGGFEDDVWSLGIVFYQMINQRFPRFSKAELLEKVLRNELTEEEFNAARIYGNTRKDMFHGLIAELKKEAKTFFGANKPGILPKNQDREEDYEYQRIEREMQILCWDMLFAEPKLSAQKVLERTKEIQAELDVLTRAGAH